MSQYNYTVSENARIEIRHCHNRVNVMGWDNRAVVADTQAQQNGDTLIFENRDKVMLRVPHTATIIIADCEADVRVADLAGRVELGDIGGDVALHDLRGDTLVGNIDGDLSIKSVAALQGTGTWKGDVALRDVPACNVSDIEGDASLRNMGTVKLNSVAGDLSVVGGEALNIDEAEGDVNLRQIAGPIRIGHIGDDFVASDIQNALSVDDVAGDAVLSFMRAMETKISAKGDVVIRLPKEANAELELDAPHGDLIARADMQIIEQDDSHLRGTLGNGGVKIVVESTHGDLVLEGERAQRHEHRHGFDRREFQDFGQEFAGFGQEFARMGQEIAQEVRESVRASMADLPRHGRHHFVMKSRRQRDEQPEASDAPAEAAPPPEVDRQAILDAIARGEMSVDDAIKKIRGEA